jgi:hypothetical protein
MLPTVTYPFVPPPYVAELLVAGIESCVLLDTNSDGASHDCVAGCVMSESEHAAASMPHAKAAATIRKIIRKFYFV